AAPPTAPANPSNTEPQSASQRPGPTPTGSTNQKAARRNMARLSTGQAPGGIQKFRGVVSSRTGNTGNNRRQDAGGPGLASGHRQVTCPAEAQRRGQVLVLS